MYSKSFFILFVKLRDVNEFWDWSRNIIASGLRVNSWYNGKQPLGLAGYINDRNSRIIGYATFRQLRMKPGIYRDLFNFFI